MGKKFGDPNDPLLGELPFRRKKLNAGMMDTISTLVFAQRLSRE